MLPDGPDFGRALVPPSVRPALIREARQRLGGLHSKGVYAYLRRWYYWPQMRQDIAASARRSIRRSLTVTKQMQVTLPGLGGEELPEDLGTLDEWRDEQTMKLTNKQKKHIFTREADDLRVYRPHGEIGRILVPESRRTTLTRLV